MASILRKLSKGSIKEPAVKEFTEEEVAEHNKKDDIWIIYKEKVYNLTAYLKEHPGGEAMLRQAGKDATEAMSLITSHVMADGFIRMKLTSCCVGVVKDSHESFLIKAKLTDTSV